MFRWKMFWILIATLTSALWILPALAQAQSLKMAETHSEPTIYLGYAGRVRPEWGFVIERVDRGTAAEQLGLQPGDVIFALNGAPIRASGQYYRLLQTSRGKVTLTIELKNTGKLCERTFLLRAVGNHWEVQPELESGEREQWVGQTR